MKLRKEIKAKKIRPMPGGCLVTGRLGVYESPVSRCVGHVWLTRDPTKNDAWQSGYAQGALCINCGDEIPPRDSSWWMEAASDKYIGRAVRMCKQEIQRLREAISYLEEAME